MAQAARARDRRGPGDGAWPSILAALTGTSVDNATDWTNFVKRNWTEYIDSRRNGS
ncbi:hypothetical protein GCM10010390_27550 [Streptomyces mordarskii]|uniref:Uncharacterized protein n=1 Tax=Streptomyces mordarskii TaxID=1226758 RepID=A0ABP3MN31_9ACTN